MSAQPWHPATGTNVGLIDPDKPPPQVRWCREHAHPTDSFQFGDDKQTFEQFRCDVCRIIWHEPV